MKPLQHKVGVITLVIGVAFFVVTLLFFSLYWVFASTDPTLHEATYTGREYVPTGPASFSLGLTFGLLPLALSSMLSGLAFILYGNYVFNRHYKEAQYYAQLNGWQAVSKVAWHNRRRDTAFQVAQSIRDRTYFLTIDARERIVVNEFDSGMHAMAFGDWLWHKLQEEGRLVTQDAANEERDSWYRNGKPMLGVGRS